MAWLLPVNLLLLTMLVRWKTRTGWTRAYFLATLLFGAALALLTEGLSWRRWLTPAAALATQAALALTLAALAGYLWRATPPSQRPRWPEVSRETLLSWSLPLLILSIAAYLAWITPPNTIDAWTYHLARVIHWAQDHSVAPYPTHILRQIYQMPWAEETILWLRLLTGNDHLAAFVQWWALLSLFIVMPDFAQLIVPRASSVWARWSIAAIPMAILQASSTQNDLVLAYWAVGFLYALLLYRRSRNPHWLLAGALALGLALRTKGTAYPWLFVFGVWWLVLMLRDRQWRWLVLAAVFTGALVAGPWYRNWEVFGHPFGSPGVRQFYFMEELDGRGWASNNLRQMASNASAGYPYIPHTAFSLATPAERGVTWVHQHLLHLEPSDPRFTEKGHTFYVPDRKFPSEDEGGALTYLIILLLATPLGLWKGNRTLRAYLIALWASWGLFTALIKWQPWITRLQLPWLLMGIPVVVWLLQWASRERKWAAGLALLTILSLVPRPLFQNVQRPLQGANDIRYLSPTTRLFLPARNLQQPYVQAMSVLKRTRCDQIGLYTDANGPEYVFWYLLSPSKPGLRLEHVLVTNPTARFAASWPPFTPCALIVTRPDFDAPAVWDTLGHRYRRVFANAKLPLFVYLMTSKTASGREHTPYAAGNGKAGGLSSLASSAGRSTISPSSSTSTTMPTPSSNAPASKASEMGSSTFCWITRRRGRAPISGS